MRLGACFVLALAGCLSVVSASGRLYADDAGEALYPPEFETAQALDELTAWLGKSEYGPDWRKFLKLELLEKQLDRAGDATKEDLAELSVVLAQLQSQTSGLEHPRFVKLRRSLEAWRGELAMPSLAELPNLARAAKAQFVPINPADVARAKQEAVDAAARMNRFLGRGGAAGRAWLTYLKSEAMQSQLAAAKPNPGVLAATLEQLSADHPGLELDEFLSLRRTLRRYLDLANFSANPGAKDQIAAQLDALASEFERYLTNPTADDEQLIGRRLGFLKRTGQAVQLRRAVERHFQNDNLIVQVAQPVVAAGMEGPVDDTSPVEEMILGTDVRGTGHTRGKLQLRFIPDERRATIETLMTGQTLSDTIGYNGPVRIFSDSVTQVRAVKRIVIDRSGVAALPATSQASTSTTINDIAANRGGCLGRIIERAAWKRATRDQSLAEEIGSRKAERRLTRRVDDQAAEMVQKSNQRFQEEFRGPLTRRGEFPRRLRISTSPDSLHLVATQAGDAQLAAPSSFSPALPEAYPLSVRLHQTWANNFAAAVLGGVTITSENLPEWFERKFGEAPEKLRNQPNEKPWSMTLATANPLSIDFRDSGFKLTIRGTKYTSGDQNYEAMNVTAVYKIEKTATGSKLARQGDLEILPPGFNPETDTLNPRQSALRTLLTKRFNTLLEPEMVGAGFMLPGRFVNAGKFNLAQLRVERGWLVLGWNRETP